MNFLDLWLDRIEKAAMSNRRVPAQRLDREVAEERSPCTVDVCLQRQVQLPGRADQDRHGGVVPVRARAILTAVVAMLQIDRQVDRHRSRLAGEIAEIESASEAAIEDERDLRLLRQRLFPEEL